MRAQRTVDRKENAAVPIVVCLIFMAALAPLQAAALDRVIKPELAHKLFLEAEAISKRDNSALWGKPLYGPVIFVDRQTRQVVANQRDAEKRLTPEGDVFVGRLPETENIANTAVKWSGTKWTMMIWPISGDKFDRARLIGHELFHRIQDDVGLPMANPSNAHLDSKDGRIWLQLEWRALAAALRSAGDQRNKAIQDALIFRAYRRSLFPTAADEERALEINEGLAEYTGKKLCGLDENALFENVAGRLDSAVGESGYMRSFAYVSGPPYGLLLDASLPTWRKGLTGKDDLGNLLAQTVPVASSEDLAAQAANRADQYDGSALMAAEAIRAADQEKRLATLRRKFVAGPVIRLPLGDAIQYSYEPNGLSALDDGGTVYSTLRVVDQWGILEVTAGGLMRSSQDRLSEAIVPAPALATGAPITGDGYTLTLNPGWSLVKGPRAGDLMPKKD